MADAVTGNRLSPSDTALLRRCLAHLALQRFSAGLPDEASAKDIAAAIAIPASRPFWRDVFRVLDQARLEGLCEQAKYGYYRAPWLWKVTDAGLAWLGFAGSPAS